MLGAPTTIEKAFMAGFFSLWPVILTERGRGFHMLQRRDRYRARQPC